jgi:perosamine synthetase
MRGVEAQGVPVRGYFLPAHCQPYLRDAGIASRAEGLPVTESVAKRTIALPFHNNLTDADIEQVVSALKRAVEQAD